MLRKPIRKNERDERKDPGEPEDDYCSPGSIEQQLDMCETGPIRGDRILRESNTEDVNDREDAEDRDPVELVERVDDLRMDLSEPDREGDEMSGDEHSGGLQGGEQEIEDQLHLTSGLPGDRSRREDESDRIVYSNPEDKEDLGLVERRHGQLLNRQLRRKQR